MPETDPIQEFDSPLADEPADDGAAPNEEDYPTSPPSRDADLTKEQEEFLLSLGWRKDYNRETYRCCNGDQWCNTDDLGCSTDEALPMYDRLVLGTTSMMVNLMVGIGTLFLRVGHLRRVRIGRAYFDGKQRLTRLEKCP